MALTFGDRRLRSRTALLSLPLSGARSADAEWVDPSRPANRVVLDIEGLVRDNTASTVAKGTST